MRRGRHAALLLAVLAVALAAAGCGGAGRGAGAARLWITRDRGAVTMLDATVPAGQSLLRALRSRAKVTTKYGGRFVESVDGVAGSLSRQHDWFWFVNGIAGGTSAAEYRLRAGDVVWWDYRDWSHDPDVPVVAGAFPEPFVHGFGGAVRPAVVRFADGLGAAARRVARRLRAVSTAPIGRPVPPDANLLVLVRGPTRLVAAQRTEGAAPGSPVVFTFSGDVVRLLAGAYARRFSVP